MHLIDRLTLRISRLPELEGLEKNEKKRITRSCRWKVFRHWQYWLTSIAVSLFSIFLSVVIGLWYINFKFRVFTQPLLSFSAFSSVFLILALAYLSQQIKIYYLAQHLVQAMEDKLNYLNIKEKHEQNQKLRRKIINRGIWLFLPLLLTVFVCVAITIQNPDSGPTLKMPDELSTPRIIKNLPGMTKKVYLEDTRLGVVTDIVFQNNSRMTILAGTMGALFTGPGIAANFVPFEKRQEHINVIQLNSRGVFGFMNRGSWCREARVMDFTGKPLWSYGAGLDGVNDMVSGDIDGDDIPEFAVGFNGGGGIHLLNNQGMKLWEFPDGNVWHVEMVDLNGDGVKSIVHSNASGDITVRDNQGKILSRNEPKPYFSHFSLIRWPDTNSPERLFHVEENAIWILNANANVLAKFTAPNSGSLGEGRGVLVAVNNKDRVLATIVNYENWQRSILYLHDLSGDLLYQEILPESCPTIAISPNVEAQANSLVIGCEGKVIEYHIPQGWAL